MSYQHHLLLLRTITPLHVGCGQDVGVVDLPVIRERTTGYPFLPGSGLRGALRARLEADAAARPLVAPVFGPEADDWGDGDDRYAGSLAVHDAKLLLFPVRADRQVFLWLTCPAALARLAAELDIFAPGSALAWPDAPQPDEGELVAPEGLADPGARVHLEELAFAAAGDDNQGAARTRLGQWAGEIERHLGLPGLASRTVLVADAVFHHFVHHATVLQQHNRLTVEKTVEKGGLFSVEAVPPEAVFFGFVGAAASRWPEERARGDEWPAELSATMTPDAILALVRSQLLPDAESPAVVHLGGGESTGLGVTRLHWLAGGNEKGTSDAD